MTDVVVDLLLSAVAVVMVLLALQVHSLEKKISFTPSFTPASTPLSTQESVPLAVKEPEKSVQEKYLDWLDHKEGNKSNEPVSVSTKPSEVKAPVTDLVVTAKKEDVPLKESVEKVVSPEVENPKKPFDIKRFVEWASEKR